MTQQQQANLLVEGPAQNDSLNHFRQLGCDDVLKQKQQQKRSIPEFVPSGKPTLTPADAVNDLLQQLGATPSSSSSSPPMVSPLFAQMSLSPVKTPPPPVEVAPSVPFVASRPKTPPQIPPQIHHQPQVFHQPQIAAQPQFHQQSQMTSPIPQPPQAWGVPPPTQTWQTPYQTQPQYAPPVPPPQPRPNSSSNNNNSNNFNHQPHTYRHVPPRLQHLQNRFVPRQQPPQPQVRKHEPQAFIAPPHHHQMPPQSYPSLQGPSRPSGLSFALPSVPSLWLPQVL